MTTSRPLDTRGEGGAADTMTSAPLYNEDSGPTDTRRGRDADDATGLDCTNVASSESTLLVDEGDKGDATEAKNGCERAPTVQNLVAALPFIRALKPAPRKRLDSTARKPRKPSVTCKLDRYNRTQSHRTYFHIG